MEILRGHSPWEWVGNGKIQDEKEEEKSRIYRDKKVKFGTD